VSDSNSFFSTVPTPYLTTIISNAQATTPFSACSSTFVVRDIPVYSLSPKILLHTPALPILRQLSNVLSHDSPVSHFSMRRPLPYSVSFNVLFQDSPVSHSDLNFSALPIFSVLIPPPEPLSRGKGGRFFVSTPLFFIYTLSAYPQCLHVHSSCLFSFSYPSLYLYFLFHIITTV
jgi:hypothetical protein